MANYMIRNVFSHIQRRFLQSSCASSSSFTVHFLVNSCGLSSASALSASEKFQLSEKSQTPQSVLQFLKSHNFSDAQIANLIAKGPIILNCRVESKLRPKFEYLIENGVQGELLHHIILSNYHIMKTSLDSRIKPAFEYLRSFLYSDEQVALAIKRSPDLLTKNLMNVLQPNVDILIKEGVPVHTVGRLLALQPRSLLQKPKIIVATLDAVKNLGIECTDTVFLYAFRVIVQMRESTWKKKIQVYQSFGFSEESVLKAFKQFPNLLAISEAKIRKGLHFCLNTMKLERQTVFVYSNVLGYSIDKRVRPRYRVLKVLESKKLIKEIKMGSFVISEKIFRDKYIDQFKDKVPGLLELYLGIKDAKSSVLNEEETESNLGTIQSKEKSFQKQKLEVQME